MDRESITELQKIDCNCNDCKFMIRDFDKFKKSMAIHHEWQLNYFNTIRNNLYKKAADWLRRGFPDKHNVLKKEAGKMKFQFDKKEIAINYGDCIKFKKPISFIPGICQAETQSCFVHRKNINQTF